MDMEQVQDIREASFELSEAYKATGEIMERLTAAMRKAHAGGTSRSAILDAIKLGSITGDIPVSIPQPSPEFVLRSVLGDLWNAEH